MSYKSREKKRRARASIGNVRAKHGEAMRSPPLPDDHDTRLLLQRMRDVPAPQPAGRGGLSPRAPGDPVPELRDRTGDRLPRLAELGAGEAEGGSMNDDDRQKQEEQAARQFLDDHCHLLAAMASHAAMGTKADNVRDAVDEMPESMAKGMLPRPPCR